MTETELRQKVVDTASAWLGTQEGSSRHAEILNIYNAQRPLPRGTRMLSTWPWCAAFVSTVSLQCGLRDIMPTECGCPSMIRLYQEINRWVEDDAYVPSPADVVFYDWQDSPTNYATTDNLGQSDHVGIVIDCDGQNMTIIEGNNAKAAIKTAIEGKGVTVPDGTLLDGMAALIESIKAGGGHGDFVTGTFALAGNTIKYVLAHVERVPDFLLVYRIDSTTPGDLVFTVIASARVGDEMYQAAYRNTTSPSAFKSVCKVDSDGAFANGLVRFLISGLNDFKIELNMTSYAMIAGTYGYIFGNFEEGVQ